MTLCCILELHGSNPPDVGNLETIFKIQMSCCHPRRWWLYLKQQSKKSDNMSLSQVNVVAESQYSTWYTTENPS